MRTAGLALALVLALAEASASEPEQRGRFQVLDNRPGGMAALFADQRSIVAAYAAAMTRYRIAAEVASFKPSGYAVLSPHIASAKENWTWMANNGSILRRLANGLFRISVADDRGNWFTDIYCTDAGWPMFECNDGQARRMSASDTETVIFGDIKYKREIP